ncbi:MAG: hypothetical protein HON90_16755 [Halobacteriovoraceae bacterium]|nr:hypothetical protein [Halobacteriovoraceae bacterium]
MRFLVLLLLLSSCNVTKMLTSGETEVGDKFFGDNSGTQVNCTLNPTHSDCCDTSDSRGPCYSPDTSSLSADLVAFWRLEESANSTRFDTHINSYSLLDTGGNVGQNTSGNIGHAADCSTGSSGSHLLQGNITLNRSISEDLTFSFWADMGADVSGGCGDTNYVIDFNTYFIMFDNDDCENDNSDLVITWPSGTYAFRDVVDFDDGSYHHFIVLIKAGGGSVELYVDGTLFNTIAGTPSSFSHASSFGLCSDSAGAQTFGGSLDSVGIWTKALSSNEIFWLYNGYGSLN